MNGNTAKILEFDLPATVLIVDDDESILGAFVELLELDGYKPVVAHSGEEALAIFADKTPQLVFMDINMENLDGLETLKRIKQENTSVPVIIITGNGTMATAVTAMKFGAFEYLTKPIDGKTIRGIARHAIASTREFSSSAMDQKRQGKREDSPYEIIGNSIPMQVVYKLIGSIASTPNQTSVLITGESGTGKELVARAIHANSGNNREPFVAINCTALAEQLLESELFGHEKGSFTGATDRKVGKFELARKGTIFLDEIGDVAPEMQRKLLRVLQERQYEIVGGNEGLRVEARFIAATNKNLTEEVKQERFREDLFYRLNVANVELPPLRERGEDILLLAGYCLRRSNDRLAKSIRGFSEDALQFFQTYSFPGNVRQIGNMIERAVMMTKGNLIDVDIFGELPSVVPSASPSLPIVSHDFSESRDHVLNLFEKQFVVSELNRVKGNVTRAAKDSKMTRQNFQRLMKKHNVASTEFRPS